MGTTTESKAEISYLLLILFMGTGLTCAAEVNVSDGICPTVSVTDSILGFRGSYCDVNGGAQSYEFLGVTEGDEVSLHRALNMVHKGGHDYAVLLFYASWCPFSRTFRPSFSTLSSLYPSIPHFAIEESAIRPSVLSKYGVHGFPTLFLLNSTMHARYHGSRTVGSLVAFYSEVTGIKRSFLNGTSIGTIGDLSNHDNTTTEPESCPFSWARSPENLLKQETYLALATAFVILRLLYIFFPTLLVYFQLARRRYIRNMRIQSLLEYPMAYINRVVKLFKSPKEPCKRSNLQEGALNARDWASKSLATVAIGDASTIRCAPVSE